MSDESDYEYFKLRKQAKTYISKVFSFNERNPERIRQVRMVIEGNDRVHLAEIEGAMCLRLTGNIRKTQVTALITQDDKKGTSKNALWRQNRGRGRHAALGLSVSVALDRLG